MYGSGQKHIYTTPYSWRYGSGDMRGIWSEPNTITGMVSAWLLLLATQQQQGMFQGDPKETFRALNFLMKSLEKEDTEWLSSITLRERMCKHRTVAILQEVKHRLRQEFPELAENLHIGATSSDIEDFSTRMQLGMSVVLILDRIKSLMSALIRKSKEYENETILGRTHLQPAMLTTLGFRYGVYLDRLMDVSMIYILTFDMFLGCDSLGMHGPVGNFGSFEFLAELMGRKNLHPGDFLADMRPGLTFQTYDRAWDMRIGFFLADLAQLLHKMSLDFRLMASYGEIYKPKSVGQISSSSMPYKTNPIDAEKVCSLTMDLPGRVNALWSICANQGLERTLNDSALRRSTLPEVFLILDECLSTSAQMVMEYAPTGKEADQLCHTNTLAVLCERATKEAPSDETISNSKGKVYNILANSKLTQVRDSAFLLIKILDKKQIDLANQNQVFEQAFGSSYSDWDTGEGKTK